jgi:hypothetical protein
MNNQHAPSAAWQQCVERFGIDQTKNIVEDAEFGIVNGRITTNVLRSKVLPFRGLYAPPYASTNFIFDAWIFGETVPTQKYFWMPNQVRREGVVAGVEVGSTLTLIEGERALLLEIALRNTSRETKHVPLQIDISGGLDYATNWDFSKPTGEKACRMVEKENLVLLLNDTGAIAIGLPPMSREGFVPLRETRVTLAPNETASFWVAIAVGEADDVENIARRLLNNPAETARQACEEWAQRALDLIGKLPRLAASDQRLEKFYDRSLLHLVLNQWRVPEFLLHPYYSTGSVNGGCVCSYLWDFGEGWEIFPLADPAALREHIKAFLGINLTKHFAFNPISGAGWGPWYYINQEKIVFLIYYYVLLTDDEKFLHEKAGDKSIIEWVVFQALVGDRLEDDANLVDYGAGNHHLELRRSYRYDHVLPDMNARRIPVYLAAEKLCELAGHDPQTDLRERAEKLKPLIHEKLWSEENRWWFHLDPDGGKQLRYTMQMFKLIAYGAISDEEEAALIGHINEREFLSEFGFHSLSKLDPAYDQVDFDNGGGGAYNSFPPQIAERLYKAGYPQVAEDILRRIVWWGERLPYWGDSFAANVIEYRKDTPLQNTVGSIAAAQSIIFGMFGVSVDFDGNISLNPQPPSFSPSIALTNVQLRGRNFDIVVEGESYEVREGGSTRRGEIGQALQLPARKEGSAIQ